MPNCPRCGRFMTKKQIVDRGFSSQIVDRGFSSARPMQEWGCQHRFVELVRWEPT